MRTLRPSLYRTTLAALTLAALPLLACSSDGAPSSDAADNLTDIPETMFRNQKDTGNCWLYATAAWIESLEYGALIARGKARADDPTTAPHHIAPSYWDYWDWYAKITTEGGLSGKGKANLKDQLDSGGSWGAAVELVKARGMMRGRTFVTRGVKEADLTEQALAAMVDSLTSGALHTKASRKDLVLVRQELNRAFQLDDATIADLDRAFGEDGAKTFADDAKANDAVLSAADLEVRLPKPDGTTELRKLAEAIGDRAEGDDPDKRVGAWAWRVVPFEQGSKAATRAYFRRIQRALHAGVPLPISWYVPSSGDPDGDGTYKTIPETPADPDASGGHETLLDDYEIDGVPGFGRLAAGSPATAAQKEAALSDAAQIVFLRVKNSWGGKTGETKAPAGHNDLYFEFLTGTLRVCPAGAKPTSKKCEDQVPLEDVTLPAGF